MTTPNGDPLINFSVDPEGAVFLTQEVFLQMLVNGKKFPVNDELVTRTTSSGKLGANVYNSGTFRRVIQFTVKPTQGEILLTDGSMGYHEVLPLQKREIELCWFNPGEKLEIHVDVFDENGSLIAFGEIQLHWVRN